MILCPFDFNISLVDFSDMLLKFRLVRLHPERPNGLVIENIVHLLETFAASLLEE